jgi:hypothetical protein
MKPGLFFVIVFLRNPMKLGRKLVENERLSLENDVKWLHGKLSLVSDVAIHTLIDSLY